MINLIGRDEHGSGTAWYQAESDGYLEVTMATHAPTTLIITCSHTYPRGRVRREQTRRRRKACDAAKASKLATEGKAVLPGISSRRSKIRLYRWTVTSLWLKLNFAPMLNGYMTSTHHRPCWCAVSIQWTDIGHQHVMSLLRGHALQLKYFFFIWKVSPAYNTPRLLTLLRILIQLLNPFFTN